MVRVYADGEYGGGGAAGEDIMILLPIEVSVLLRSEGVDLAAPEGELAACHFPVDFKRHIVYHAARLSAHLAAVFNEKLGA